MLHCTVRNGVIEEEEVGKAAANDVYVPEQIKFKK